MKPDPVLEAQRWFSQATRDLADAGYNRDGGRHNLACFLSQQAAEKALKTFLFGRGARQVKGHSTADLCLRAAALDPGFQSVQKVAAALDKYYIPTRYPNGLPGGLPSEAFDDHDAARALQLASSVLEFVSQHLPA